jgi:hypothetical protein
VIDFRSPLITKCSKIVPGLLGRHQGNLLEDMRGRRLIRHKPKLQMIDNPIQNGLLRDESDDLHRPPALGADHRVNLINFSDHFRPALRWDRLRLLLGHPLGEGDTVLTMPITNLAFLLQALNRLGAELIAIVDCASNKATDLALDTVRSPD